MNVGPAWATTKTCHAPASKNALEIFFFFQRLNEPWGRDRPQRCLSRVAAYASPKRSFDETLQ